MKVWYTCRHRGKFQEMLQWIISGGEDKQPIRLPVFVVFQRRVTDVWMIVEQLQKNCSYPQVMPAGIDVVFHQWPAWLTRSAEVRICLCVYVRLCHTDLNRVMLMCYKTGNCSQVT